MAEEKSSSQNAPEENHSDTVEKKVKKPSAPRKSKKASPTETPLPDTASKKPEGEKQKTPSTEGKPIIHVNDVSPQVEEQSFIQQAKDFFRQYKAEISLAILLLYVLTLAIATIIEILDH